VLVVVDSTRFKTQIKAFIPQITKNDYHTFKSHPLRINNDKRAINQEFMALLLFQGGRKGSNISFFNIPHTDPGVKVAQVLKYLLYLCTN